MAKPLRHIAFLRRSRRRRPEPRWQLVRARVTVTATVIDADAQRIAMLRGDRAGAHTFEASWGKAYTAVAFAPIFKLDSSGAVAARLARFSAKQPLAALPFQPPEHMIFRAG